MFGLVVADLADRFGGWPADDQYVGPGVGRYFFAGGFERLVADNRICAEELVEDGVHRTEDARPRTEVVGQTEPAGFVAVANLSEEADFRTPEAINRLFGVADEEQPSAIDGRVEPAAVVKAGDQVDELNLQGIGVLELIDAHHLPAVARRPADLRVVA